MLFAFVLLCCALSTISAPVSDPGAESSSRQIVIAHGSKPVSRPPPAGLPPIEGQVFRPKSLYSPTSNKIVIANGTKLVARPLPASLPPKDGSNVNDRSESQPALTTLTGLELIEGRVYKLNRRLSMGITQDGLESGRVFYIGPVLDPSLKLKDNDFFVFVSPFSKELGVDNKIYEEYFKRPQECFSEFYPSFDLPIDTGYAFVTKASLLKKGPPWMDSFKWKAGLLKEIQANMQKNYERRPRGDFISLEFLSQPKVHDNKGNGSANSRHGGRPS